MHIKKDGNEKYPRQDFQVERITFFSDAVFANALTLLVIEFKKQKLLTKADAKQNDSSVH